MNPADEISEYDNLTSAAKAALAMWIDRHLQPAERPLRGCTSYTLKHEFEHSAGGFYVTNGQFKGAMRAAGYKPVNYEQNWRFRIARR